MNTGEEEAVLERIAATLGEMLVWIRVTSYPAVAQIIRGEFPGGDADASTRAKVYAMTDGKRSSREISAAVGGTPRFNTIAGMHAKWRRMGLAALVNPKSQRSPTRALFNLSDFGIDVALLTSMEAGRGAVEGNDGTEGTP